METVVVAVFENRTHAQRARAHLLDAGLLASAVRSVAGGLAAGPDATGAIDPQVSSGKVWRVETKAFSGDEQQRALTIANEACAVDVEVHKLHGNAYGLASGSRSASGVRCDPGIADGRALGGEAAPNGDEKSYPMGTGIGAAAGGLAAGALAAAVAGPFGTVLGVAAGAVAGGLAGKDLAQALDPSAPRVSGSS